MQIPPWIKWKTTRVSLVFLPSEISFLVVMFCMYREFYGKHTACVVFYSGFNAFYVEIEILFFHNVTLVEKVLFSLPWNLLSWSVFR